MLASVKDVFTPREKWNPYKKEWNGLEEIEACRDNVKDDRERALLELMLSTGMRVGEIARLRAEDIDFYKMYSGRRAYCGANIKFKGMQINHKIPLAINGEDTKENMLPACRSCNKYKHTLDVEGFREYLSGIQKRVRRGDIAFQVGERYGLLQENKVPVVFYFEKVRENEKI